MECKYCGSNEVYVETEYNDFTDTREVMTCSDCGREL